MAWLKQVIKDLETKIAFRAAKGLTPAGYHFMQYCKGIMEGNSTVHIMDYERVFEMFAEGINAAVDFELNRTQIAIVVYNVLEGIYKEGGIIQ